jgi:isopentenyldiphosphate isomerase
MKIKLLEDDPEYQQQLIEEIITYHKENNVPVDPDEVREQFVWKSNKELRKILLATQYTYSNKRLRKKQQPIE